MSKKLKSKDEGAPFGQTWNNWALKIIMTNGFKCIKYIHIHEFIVLLKKENPHHSPLDYLRNSLFWKLANKKQRIKHVFCYVFQGTQIVCKSNKCTRTGRIRKSLSTTPNESLGRTGQQPPIVIGIMRWNMDWKCYNGWIELAQTWTHWLIFTSLQVRQSDTMYFVVQCGREYIPRMKYSCTKIDSMSNQTSRSNYQMTRNLEDKETNEKTPRQYNQTSSRCGKFHKVPGFFNK